MRGVQPFDECVRYVVKLDAIATRERQQFELDRRGADIDCPLEFDLNRLCFGTGSGP
jgi:hypothetical protein